MDRHRTKPMLLARIPDLNVTAKNIAAVQPTSHGRIIDQAISFKLLAAVALLLVVVAVVPFALSTGEQSSDSSITADQLPPWNPGAASPPIEAAAAETVAVVEAPQMSSWPNPTYPVSDSPEAGLEPQRAGVNQAMAIRPPEHIRDSHDHTRPSVH